MLQNNGIDKTLYFSAETKSKFNMQINARVIPQPKQEIPNTFLIMHKEQLKILVKI